MLQTISNGQIYKIVPVDAIIEEGWITLGTANCEQEARKIAEDDWERFWSECGIIPSFSITVRKS